MIMRLAQNESEITQAQRLRYHVFKEEQGLAKAGEASLDADHFDTYADHLLVIEQGETAGHEFPLRDGNLVGTYRLLPSQKATQAGGFYSEQEFDLKPLLAKHPTLNFLELGRSCTLKRARNGAVIDQLWQGIWDYVRHYKVDVMIGCASFPGSDPEPHAAALNFLSQNVPVHAGYETKALEAHYNNMKISGQDVNLRTALRNLPPLIKGYLSLGCCFADGYVIDKAFNTIDVLVILPVNKINPRFFARFGQPT